MDDGDEVEAPGVERRGDGRRRDRQAGRAGEVDDIGAGAAEHLVMTSSPGTFAMQ
jgi:hypothetical protein